MAPTASSFPRAGVLDLSIWRQKNSLTVHLVNLTNPMMMKGPVREIIPVSRQQVRDSGKTAVAGATALQGVWFNLRDGRFAPYARGAVHERNILPSNRPWRIASPHR